MLNTPRARWRKLCTRGNKSITKPFSIIICRPTGKSDLPEQHVFDLHISNVSEEGTLWMFPISEL